MTDAPLNATTAYAPAYNDIHNINTDTLEFSAGGQIQTIDLKYNSSLRQLECTKDYAANSVNHGIVYGYLVQPLTYNSNVPTSITFNVYISGGENLQFSGYALDPVDIVPGTNAVYPGLSSSADSELGSYEVLPDDSHTGRILNRNEANEQDINRVGISTNVLNLVDSLASIDAINIPNFNSEGMEVVEGINTLVTPNSQSELLNEQTPCDENVLMSFRPNTSVRDYLRYMYPQATLTYTPTGLKSVVPFELNKLINKFKKADYFHAISSLYMGISGGFKLKFKISGATCASAMYVPPSYHCYSSTSSKRFRPMCNALPTDTNAEANFLDGMTYNPNTKSYTAPQIEIQDYTRPYNNALGDIKSKPGSTFVLEMAIPNMNQFNFVGNASKWYENQVPGVIQSADVENDLGVVYLNIEVSNDESTAQTQSYL